MCARYEYGCCTVQGTSVSMCTLQFKIRVCVRVHLQGTTSMSLCARYENEYVYSTRYEHEFVCKVRK